MTVRELLRQPGVGHKVVRGVIGAAPGTTKEINVTVDGKPRVVRATILRKIGTKLTDK
jgi:hypothetical protein